MPDCPSKTRKEEKRRGGDPCHVHGLRPKVSSAHYAPAARAAKEVEKKEKGRDWGSAGGHPDGARV